MALRDIQAVFLLITAGRSLEANRPQFFLHFLDPCARHDDAEDQRNQDPDQAERLFGYVAVVIGCAGCRLRDKIIAKIGEFVKSIGKFAVGQIRRQLFADIADSSVCKGPDRVAAGRDPPVVVFHADQQQQAALLRAIAVVAVIIDIVCIVAG